MMKIKLKRFIPLLIGAALIGAATDSYYVAIGIYFLGVACFDFGFNND